MSSFVNKVAIVTGGGSGIGRAAALAFARDGARVVVADIDANGGGSTVEIIERTGGKAVFVKTDVTSSDQVEAMVGQAVDKYGRLDAAFNCAGILTPACALTSLHEDVWDRVININLKGVWLSMKYEIPRMLVAKAGSIVNVSSISGLTGSPGWTAYDASKHGVIGLTRTAALEFAKAGIRVNAVCPCQIDTPMIRNLSGSDSGYKERIGVSLPGGRIGTAEEVAAAVLWLCSDVASLVNGAALPVDGGFLAGVSFWRGDST